MVGKPFSQKERYMKQDIHHLLKAAWRNYRSQEQCKWERKSYLTTPISYAATTTFSPLAGDTECDL